MNYDDPIPQNKDDRMDMEMESWIYQSHCWKKVRTGAVVCHWCRHQLGPTTSMSNNLQVCTQNPKIKIMREFWVTHTIEAVKHIQKEKGGDHVVDET